MTKQDFVITRNPPNFCDGLKESWNVGSSLRGSHDPKDGASFERELQNSGVGRMNFRLWLSGDYAIPAIQAAWLGWQGTPLN